MGASSIPPRASAVKDIGAGVRRGRPVPSNAVPYSALVLNFVVNLVRGALIGVAEVIPGVSGGTIALIVGIYRTVIDAIANAVLAIRQLVGLSGEGASARRCAGTLRRLPWALLIPVAIGMITAVVLGARLIEPLLEQYPVQMRALFFGLVLAGVWVPAHMVHRIAGWRPRYLLMALVSAVALFFITGLPPTAIENPSPLVILLAAAAAICALVLPGVSGSFLLLSIGLYEPTIQAVNDRNFGYLGVFFLGAFLGLAFFVSLLKWLLEHRAAATLAVVTGLMLGSLRALWPWQSEGRDLLPPGESLGIVLVLAGVGVVIVALLLLAERRLGISEEQVDLDAPAKARD